MKLLIFPNQSANTVTKLKTIRKDQFLVAFAELLEQYFFKRMKNHPGKWVLL